MSARRLAQGLALVAVLATVVAGCCRRGQLKTIPTPAPAPAAAPAEPTPAPVRVVALPSASDPLVAVRLVWELGAADDPAGEEGLTALTAAMLASGGSAARTYAEVLDALYPMAASIGWYTTRDTTVLHGVVHRDNLDAFTELLLDQVLRPRFDPGDFDRLRREASDHVAKRLRSDDDEELGKHALHAAMYAGHPYAHPARGTVDGLAALTLDRVRAWHASHFTVGALVLGVAGGYPEGYADGLAAQLGTLTADRPPRAELPAPAPHAPGLDVLIVDKPTRATAISIGHPLPVTRADDDFYPLAVAASYLGEHRTFNGVLMQNMRGKRGLNYGDYAYIESFIQQGWSTFPLPNIQRRQQHFEIWIRPVAPHNAAFSLRQALYELDKLRRDGIPQQAFEDTRQFLMAYGLLWTQSGSRRLGYAIDGELVGRHVVSELNARLATTTKADVDAAVRKYLLPEQLTVAIATADGTALRDQLLSGEPTPITYDTEGTPEAILAEDRVIEAFPLGLTADRVRVVPVGTLFQQ